ncbi:MAG TPA: cytochrome c family protein [Thermohalobaculum sp.]|nr:cytochrome c family protein [Thermohalobaculum sp.]
MTRKMATVLAVLAATGFAGVASAEGDADAGKKVFNKCKACHMVGDGAKNRVGPILNGIAGATAGAVADFKYSDAMMAKGAEGLVWTDENLAAYLEKPKDFIPGNKMTFAGLKKEDDRANVIAYLKTFP